LNKKSRDIHYGYDRDSCEVSLTIKQTNRSESMKITGKNTHTSARAVLKDNNKKLKVRRIRTTQLAGDLLSLSTLALTALEVAVTRFYDF
jgi:hypothetical protein